MKLKLKMKPKIISTRSYYFAFLFLLLLTLGSCNNEIPKESHSFSPPDLNEPSALESFSPKQGGVGTKLVLKGLNLGSDTSCLKVFVNDKEATIIGANNGYVYAVVAARSDGSDGTVKIQVKKGDKTEVYTATDKFDYQIRQNVTTVLGKRGDANRVDGVFQIARIKRPWNIIRDKDDVVYVLEEGGGTGSGDGALRRIKDGQIETVLTNSSGPMQHPAALAFSPKEDTLYVTNFRGGNVKVFCLTRSMGFMDPKPLVSYRNGGNDNICVGIAAHPVTGEVFFYNHTSGYICRWKGKGFDPEDASQELYKVNNQSNIEAYLRFHDDWLYIVSLGKHCIYRAQYNPLTRTLSEPELYAGSWGTRGDSDASVYIGRKETVLFAEPGLPDWDIDGNMYVPNRYGYVIQKIDKNGNVSLVTSRGRSGGGDLVDGTPDIARFDQPSSLVILSDQSIFVTDQSNSAIRKIVVE